MVRVRGSAFKRRRTSKPLTFGSFKSMMMTLGRLAAFRWAWRPVQKMYCNASAPSGRTCRRAASPAFLKVWMKKSTSSGLSSTSKISTVSSGAFILIRSFESEIKRRALFRLALSPYTTAVTVDDALHNRQADACAFKFFRRMQPLENAEKFVHVFHLKTRAVVFNEIDILSIFITAADSDDC